ncbi:MAG TPA: DUF1579 family protein [Terriglobia bacterium]|nr:DUF1579 family protein [Terriglobia bacterium]
MNRLSRLMFVLALALAGAGPAPAQAPPQAPKPSPDHKKLEYYVGRWTLESDVKASPFGPAGKNTGTEEVELGPGGFFAVFRDDVKGPAGPMKATGILGYDGGAKNYTYYGVDSNGGVNVGTGKVAGNVWTWNTESKVAGKLVKGRATASITSPSSYTFKFEIADDKGAFITIEEGKAMKTK